jgi:TRAP-type C4-dicarboxylate transport system substrate-binding protein
VTSQFVLTGHVIGYDMMAITSKVWDAMSPAQQAKFQTAAEKAIDECTARYNAQEKDVIEFFRSRGLVVYSPNVSAFRSFAQKKYLESAYAKDWPKGALERINAIN